MKRKTAVCLICLSALLCWVLFTGALCAFSFVHLKTVLQEHCRTYFSYYLDEGRTEIKVPAQTVPVALADRQNPVYPYFAALFREDGSLLFRTGSCFVGAALDKSYVVDLEEQLTAQNRDDILAQGYRVFSNPVRCTFLLPEAADDASTAISLTISANPLESRKFDTMTFLFDEGMRQHQTGSCTMTGNLYLFHRDKLCDKQYQSFLEQIKSETFRAAVRETVQKAPGRVHPDRDEESSLVFRQSHAYVMQDQTTGQRYLLYETCRYPLIPGFLQKDGFLVSFFAESAFFLLFAAALLLLTGILQRKKARLEEAKLLFLNAAAHELKTPLSIIAGQCECILEQVAPQKNQSYVQSIYAEAESMDRLIRSLLEYGKLQAARQAAQARLDLSALVKECIGHAEPQFAAKGLKLQTQIAEDLTIRGNQALLALAVGNLLSNAAQYAPTGDTVCVALTQKRRRITFTVTNSGTIVPGHVPQLWEVFFRADEARTGRDSASGFGLAICKRVLQLHRLRPLFRQETGRVTFGFWGRGLKI